MYFMSLILYFYYTESHSNPLPFIAYHFILSRTTLSQIGTSKLPMRQLTQALHLGVQPQFSKLPMRQLTSQFSTVNVQRFSKLPMRQLTTMTVALSARALSKLPMRQLT